ncbi:MAG: 3'-5' exonuclease [Clostridiales bacterium]|nr:3'-5' exonuclease [Clostridiales bacterium]
MVLYFDTETTGLHPGQICQLSYVMQTGEELLSRNFFFKVDSVEYSAFMVHGFSVERLESLSGGKTFADYVNEIEKDFSNADVVIAHNYSFDQMFMRAEFERLGKVFSVKREFCSMKKSTPLCALKRSRGEGYKYPKLSELCAFLEINDMQIQRASEEMFGAKVGFHDARFDTTALCLAVNRAIRYTDAFSILDEFI